MKINYNNKVFRPVSNTDNGETSEETLFHYYQEDNVLYSSYKGGKIKYGHLIGLVDNDGNIEMRYHQVNSAGVIMTGKCNSTPVILEDGRIKLFEK